MKDIYSQLAPTLCVNGATTTGCADITTDPTKPVDGAEFCGLALMAVLQREYGRKALLHQIRRAGPVPRIELADQTGISRATVTTITAELLQNGLIEEVARPEIDTDARRGRPRVDLKTTCLNVQCITHCSNMSFCQLLLIC